MKKIIVLFLFSGIIWAQKTQQYNEEKGSVKANLQDVSWLIGNWKSTNTPKNELSEEIWCKPSGKTMHFSFKMVKDNKVIFYEIGHIIEVGKTIELKMKHFDGDLNPIEMHETFKYIKSEKTKILFDGITYEKVGNNKMNVYVFMEDQNKEVKFEFLK